MSTFDGSPAPARGASCDHAVQFYEHDEFLFGVVAEFLASGLAAGQPAIVIATPEHREGFVRALAKKTGVQGAGGGLTLLDAREMLGTFMVGGSPDPALFRAHVGGTLESCARASDKNGSTLVHAYGEMVDLLWKDGNRQGAIRLEELWNDLAVAHRFSLLCAYAMGSFYRQSHSEDFDRICTAHGRVAAAETWRHDEHVDPMREVARLQQRALALESEVEKRDELERALREALSRRREEEGFLRSILRASDDCVKVLDLEGRLLYLSEGGCRSLR
jgi:PAS domain-containing protein